MTLRTAPVLGVVLVLSACARLVDGTAQPAVLGATTAADRVELARVVGEALHRPPVLLGDDALTHGDVLIVERQPRRDAAGVRLNGRELDRPERFRLVWQRARCILIHDRSGHRWTLRQGCTPRPLPP